MDPSKKWKESLSNYHILFPASNFARLVDLIFMLCMIVHFTYRFLIKSGIDDDINAYYGLYFRLLGFSGKMLDVAGIAVCCSSAYVRILFWVFQSQNKLQFLTDLESMRWNPFLTKPWKADFCERSDKIHYACQINSRMGYLSTITFSLILFYQWIMKDGDDPYKILLWIFWESLNIKMVYQVVVDLFHTACLWMTCLMYINGMQATLTSDLEQLVLKKYTRKWRQERDFSRFVKQFRYFKKILDNFNVFSGYFQFIMTSTTTVINVTLLYAIIKDKTKISIALAGVLPCYVIISFAFHYAVATVSLNSKKLDQYLRKLNFQFEGRIGHRVFIKRILDNRISISLKTLDNQYYDLLSFGEYLSDLVSTIILVFDFMEDFFRGRI